MVDICRLDHIQDTLIAAETISLLRGGSYTTVGSQIEGNLDRDLKSEDFATMSRRKVSNDMGREKLTPYPKPVLVLNFASDSEPGGRWIKGDMGQEAELFYRTSLSYSLKSSLYPLQLLNAVYSPMVFVIRSPHSGPEGGHKLLFDKSLLDPTAPPTSPLTQKTSEYCWGLRSNPEG